MDLGGAQPFYVLDRAASQAVDRAATSEFGIPSILLMENAACGLKRHALDMLRQQNAASSTTLILCGSGNNGGDGYALARHLHNAGVAVTIAAQKAPDTKSDAGINRTICERMNLPIIPFDELDRHEQPHLIVDAIFGTGLDRPIEGRLREVIAWTNESHRPVLAVDVPSGLNCDTSDLLGATIHATRTVTFVGFKPAMLKLALHEVFGDIYVASIGAPLELIARFGTPAPASLPDHLKCSSPELE